MRVRFHETASALLTAADPFFRADPYSANVIAVVAARVAAGTRSAGDAPLWVTIENGNGPVVGVAMHTPPHLLFLSRMPRQAAAALARTLADAKAAPPGVNGAREATTAFADAWCELTGRSSSPITAMRMYRLEELRRPDSVPGAGRRALASGDVGSGVRAGGGVAASGDAGLVAAWLAAFHDEAQPHAPVLEWRSLAEQRIAAGEIQLWCDGGPVSLAAVSAPGAGVARIGPVYTPASARRRGYGSAVTAEAAAAAIAAGAEQVVLYTDLANPTSNSIYQALGFRPDHDAEERLFR